MGADVARSVYVISDLHLGGVYSETPQGRGFRINTHARQLAEFVQSIAQKPAAGPKIELVINGDMVDFLAEREAAPPQWIPFTADPEAACAKLKAIADRDPAFFTALHDLLEANHRLTILTGNHDIELAFPLVRKKLREIIGVKPNHDFEFISNGEAYIVGDALIEHGNRYDKWNVVDYDSLRRVSSLQSRRQPIPQKWEFDPPAGSKMVSWVINQIKEDYKFIDLLKPETDVAVPLLLALEPGYKKLLATIAKLALQSSRHGLDEPAVPSQGGDIHAGGDFEGMSFGGDINSGGGVDGGNVEISEEAALDQILKKHLGADRQVFADEPEGGGDISSGNVVDRAFGIAKLLFAPSNPDIGRRLPALLKALRALQPDRSFDVGFEAAPEYADAARDLLKCGFRFVVFGHTHLAKKIELEPGHWYLNSGSWSDTMQLPQAILTANPEDARAELERFVQQLGTSNLSHLIVFNPTFVQLDLDTNDHVLNAELVSYGNENSALADKAAKS